MSTAGRLGVFAVGLATAFAIGAGVGAAVGPIDVGDESPAPHVTHDGATEMTDPDRHGLWTSIRSSVGG